MIHNVGDKSLKYKLSQHARLRYDESTENYYLFRIDSGAQYRLNKMGYVIWLMLEEGKSLSAITKRISETLSTDNQSYSKDIDDFFNFLLDNELIRI